MPPNRFRLHPALVPQFRPLRIVVFLLMLLTAAWSSFVSWGGLYVFGGRVHTLWEFLFFALPVVILPLALLAAFFPRVAAILLWLIFVYVALFVLKVNWPHVFTASTVLFEMFRYEFLAALLASFFSFLERKAVV